MPKAADYINSAMDEVKKYTAPLSEVDRTNILLNIESVRYKYVNIIERERFIHPSELVVCAECKHGQQVGKYGVLCEYGLEELRPMDHFCAWGERREFGNEDNEAEE